MANDANSRRADRQVKNLFVNAHQISLRFELLFWDGLNTCGRDQGKLVYQLANIVLNEHAHLTSFLLGAVRLLTIAHFR